MVPPGDCTSSGAGVKGRLMVCESLLGASVDLARRWPEPSVAVDDGSSGMDERRLRLRGLLPNPASVSR